VSYIVMGRPAENKPETSYGEFERREDAEKRMAIMRMRKGDYLWRIRQRWHGTLCDSA
jgi:hypothetical protein